MHTRLSFVLICTAIAGLCTAVRGANVNNAFIATEASANETNPVFPGPVGGTLTAGYFGDIDGNAGTPDTFASFVSGASPVGDHDNQFGGNPLLQGFYKNNSHGIPATIVNTSGAPTTIYSLSVAADQIFMHPGNTAANAIAPPFFDAVLRYTVPSTGFYTINGSFDSIDVGYTLNLIQLNETTTLFSQDESLFQPGAFNLINVPLAAGDKIDFAVSGNGNIFGDSTGLTANIVPEPSSIVVFSSLALTLLGRRRA